MFARQIGEAEDFLAEKLKIQAESAYMKGSPILKPEDMPQKLEWNPIDGDWKKRIEEASPFWFRGCNQGSAKDNLHFKGLLELRDKLLSFGGDAVCLPKYEEDLLSIMEHGQLWYGDRITMMKGDSSQCHRNSALCWHENRDKTCIVTGYALTADGLWRQHSWLSWLKPRKNRIIETTLKRIAYFGVAMTVEECQWFVWDNA